jgi:myo-inositol-1(or 4)-monophosphatase
MGVTPSPPALLELAVAAALEAGELVASARSGAAGEAIEVARTKSSPTDVVTAADLASERAIRGRVLAARPDDGFLGEEGGDVAGTTGVVWVADPIDGTVNFVYGIPQFAVSIAAEVDGSVVAGVVHNPISGETFTATRGGGAYLGRQRLTGSDCDDVSAALVATGFGYRAEDRAIQAVQVGRLLPTVRDIRRMGWAALDLCFVAAGRCDAYVERGLNPWDLAAGGLIVEESGGRVEGLDGEPPGSRLVAAAPARLFPAFHDRLVAAGFADWPADES